jgi:hypothetical protein
VVKHQDAALRNDSARHFPTSPQYPSSPEDSSYTPSEDGHTVSTKNSTTDGSFTSGHVSVCLCSSSSASTNSLETLDVSHDK